MKYGERERRRERERDLGNSPQVSTQALPARLLKARVPALNLLQKFTADLATAMSELVPIALNVPDAGQMVVLHV